MKVYVSFKYFIAMFFMLIGYWLTVFVSPIYFLLGTAGAFVMGYDYAIESKKVNEKECKV